VKIQVEIFWVVTLHSVAVGFTFWRTLLPPSSRVKSEDFRKPNLYKNILFTLL